MNLYESIKLNNLNEKLTKDNKDTLEIGDILADSSNKYIITNIQKTPKSMSITVRDINDRKPIYMTPISDWYGTIIIKNKNY